MYNGSTPGREEEEDAVQIPESPRTCGCTVQEAELRTTIRTMSWAPVLLALLTHCTGENAPELHPLASPHAPPHPSCPCSSVSPGGGPQPVLNQPPSVSSSLGTTIRLACTLSRDHDVTLYSIYWYQQRPGHPPRFLLRYFSNSEKNRGPKVPPRFSGSKDVTQNTGYLSISELQPEDEAIYFCAVGTQNMEREKMEMEREEEKKPAASVSQEPQDTLTMN